MSKQTAYRYQEIDRLLIGKGCRPSTKRLKDNVIALYERKLILPALYSKDYIKVKTLKNLTEPYF